LKYAGTVIHGLLHFFAEVLLGDQLHLLGGCTAATSGTLEHLVAQHDADVGRAGLRRCGTALISSELPPAAEPHFAADQALARVDRVLGVRDRLALRDVTDQALAVLGDRDHGRRVL